jgi:hypothetical protein
VDGIIRDAKQQFQIVHEMSPECRLALPELMETIRKGLGESTASRKMSTDILVTDPVVIKATLLDPRFSTFWFMTVPKDRISAAFKELCDEIVDHASGQS